MTHISLPPPPGKSSYLNTVSTALKGTYSHVALAGEKAGAGTYTLKISKYNIVESFKLWDTFGWDSKNWPV